MNTRRHFLWPEPTSLTARDIAGQPCSSNQIEARLRAIFPGSDAVLFSSARAGMTATLQLLALSRPDLFWVPKFSSHCVLEAAALVCTPTPSADGDDLTAALVYHQWGHVHRPQFDTSVQLIEDAVDSFILPGSSPFAAGGNWALWSLPKVLATQAGGVVFCRQPEDAEKLRILREGRPSSAMQAWLRWRAKANAVANIYWNGAESSQGALYGPLRRQVMRQLDKLDDLAANMLELLGNISSDLCTLHAQTGRLPSNLALQIPKNWQSVWGHDGLLSAGIRSFNIKRTSPHADWVRVAPLPIHLDMTSHIIQDILNSLKLKIESNELNFI